MVIMSGVQSWNKLFEQEYLPDLVEKENTVDPVTGLSRDEEDLAQEWSDRRVQDKKKKNSSISHPSLSFLAPHDYDDDEGGRKENTRRPPMLPHINSQNNLPSSDPVVRATSFKEKSIKERKEEKQRQKEIIAKYTTSVSQNTESFLNPNVKVGVRHGDSNRMKFPMQEFLESDLRLKKVKNGYSMIKPEEAAEGREEIFPRMYFNRELAMRAPTPSPKKSSANSTRTPTRQRSEPDVKRAADSSNLSTSRLEGERDEFLTMLETKMNTLEDKLQVRREKRDEVFKSKEILLKAADTIQRRDYGIERHIDNIMDRAKQDASNDPTLLVTRVSMYMRIVEYVEMNGGIRSEEEEEIVSLLRHELEEGHPADNDLITILVNTHGLEIVKDKQLRETVQFVADMVNITHSELTEMLDAHEKERILHPEKSITNLVFSRGVEIDESVENGIKSSKSVKRMNSYQYPKIFISPEKDTEKDKEKEKGGSYNIRSVKSLDRVSMPSLPRVKSFENSNLSNFSNLSNLSKNEKLSRDVSDHSLPSVKARTLRP